MAKYAQNENKAQRWDFYITESDTHFRPPVPVVVDSIRVFINGLFFARLGLEYGVLQDGTVVTTDPLRPGDTLTISAVPR